MNYVINKGIWLPISEKCWQARWNRRGLRFAAVWVLWTLVAYGQGVRSIRGIVTDQTGHPLAGAVVQIQDRTTLQVRSYLTQDDGSYHFEDLYSDLSYHLRASYSGVSSRSKVLSKFDAHKVAAIDLTIEVSK